MASCSILFLYGCIVYSSILSGAQVTSKFPFFSLPLEIQQEIIAYVPSKESTLFIFNRNFVFTEKIVQRILEVKLQAAYKKLDNQFDTCPWGWRDCCQTDTFLKYKKIFFNQLKNAFIYESQEKKKIWLAAAQAYVKTLEEQYTNIELPQGYPQDFSRDPFILSSPSIYLNFKEIHKPDIKHEPQTVVYLLLKAMLLLDKITIFTTQFSDNNFLVNKNRCLFNVCLENTAYVKAVPLFNRCDKRAIEGLISPRNWSYYKTVVLRWIFYFVFPTYSMPHERPRLSSNRDWLL